jgi:hypothetical protein
MCFHFGGRVYYPEYGRKSEVSVRLFVCCVMQTLRNIAYKQIIRTCFNEKLNVIIFSNNPLTFSKCISIHKVLRIFIEVC